MRELPTEDVLIAGAGPIGLACAISARRRGLGSLVADGGALVNSIARYPIGMTFFTTPERLEIGSHPLACAGQKPTREEALKYYRGVVRTEELRVRTYTRLVGAHREDSAAVAELATARGGGGGGGGGGGRAGWRGAGPPPRMCAHPTPPVGPGSKPRR